MKQSFQYDSLTIEVREETGLDLIDNPQLNRIVLDYVAGQTLAPLESVSPVTWNRITTYVEFLQVSTVKGKGLVFPTTNDSAETIGKGFQVWLDYIDQHPECYRQWNRVKGAINRQTSDPQPPSAETTSTDK